jgi:YesN/AraC family two-component response regulator
MNYWFSSKGYSIKEASSGDEAINIIKKEEVDIVFMDLKMPNMDGIDTIKNIRKFNKEIPIIVISAHVDDPKASKAISLGVSGIFYKGADFEEGLALLESVLRTHKKLKDK